MKAKSLGFTCLTVFLILALSLSGVNADVSNQFYVQANSIFSGTPSVSLKSGTVGTSSIYVNGTSARVTVTAPLNGSSGYDYVLKVVNLIANGWEVNMKVYGDYNVSRLFSLNVSFHDGASSNQIAVSNGSITQLEGAPYSLAGNATAYIMVSNLLAYTTGTSYLYVYLKVRVLNTSTYNLFIILFEIT